MTGTVLLHRADGVATIEIDRPQSRNALTAGMTRQLTDIVGSLAEDVSVKVVAITAAGRDFCAGADMGDIEAAISPDPATRASSFTTGLPSSVHPLLHALLALPQPVVAAVRGHAIGLGVAIALTADLLVVSETARFSVPQVRLGHTLDHGESWLLPRRVGVAQAARMSLLAEPLAASAAERHGLAGWLVVDDELESTSRELVDQLLALPAPAVIATKRLLRSSFDMSLGDQLDSEVREAAACATTDEFVEAVRAAMSPTRRRTT
ncbi:MAG: enoyl-CoA hydratase-related protein [Nocardioides sp.]|uniref:enoyl-CoA hydratase/isomerase family protein n=1 Tax=Nocardioides sp. TaxID=35761 RepID=UPI003264602D